MPAERLPMRQVREVLRLKHVCGRSGHQIAAAVGVRLIVESPVSTIETNIRGTDIVLSLAAKKRKRVVITSTRYAITG